MRKMLGAVLLALAPAVWAETESATWVEVQAGPIIGAVDVPPCPQGGCGDVGVLPAYMVSFTHRSGAGALRIRGVRVDESGTSPDPRELAFMVGGLLNDSVLLTVGGGRIFDADDERPAPVWGLAWELAFAPLQSSGPGFAFSLLGNVGKEVGYLGIGLGIRFGDLGG